MKVVGIIAEYNPFHSGHAYQIKEIKKQTRADFIVVAMSGNFVQRGLPSVTDKYTRAHMALLCGADLVLELPTLYATSSAEYFASAGVALLASTGVVTTICYGMEEPKTELTQSIVSLLLSPTEEFNKKISAHVKTGKKFPLARQLALCECLKEFPSEEIALFLSTPNNILGIEYEKAIAKWNQDHSHQLTGHPIMRVGDGYHTDSFQSSFASATALRKALFYRKEEADFTVLLPYIPDRALGVLKDAIRRQTAIHPNDFSAPLYARLLEEKNEGYTDFADCTKELSIRIQRTLPSFTSFLGFADALHSKEITKSRINRVLLHILLNHKKEDYWPDMISYLRVLGFTEKGKQILPSIKKEGSAPLLTKVADASVLLNDSAIKQFHMDLYAADLYRGITSIKCQHDIPDEYRHSMVLVP